MLAGGSENTGLIGGGVTAGTVRLTCTLDLSCADNPATPTSTKASDAILPLGFRGVIRLTASSPAGFEVCSAALRFAFLVPF
jgi:hypothetical protein